ncbi:exosporium protein ExsF [Bacillus paramycoides]|uniref:exosporium protein ExsF n=1 Tax=Bacillus paramycoides TaxID=2026194 RepID=UPI002E201BF9|nr:exosporium protein ExsF [Bacillus paramycoides]MED0980876.1 exosporium protein ExsF [Bacillus paramycoides]
MKNTFSSDCKFTKIDCEAKPASTLTAFGFAFNAFAPQFASLFTSLLLPSTSPNPNITVPIINDTVSLGDGIKIQLPDIYQISYTLSISLDNSNAIPEAGRFFLSLDTPHNIIPGSSTAVRSNVIGTGEVDISSGVILINLNPGNLIQIVPVELFGSVDVRAAALTVVQIG